MRFRLNAAVAFCLLLSCHAAWAHRVDEYLQATLLTLDANHVHGSMRLIPGMLVAPQVIAAIDSNGDGTASAEEQHAYVDRVIGDLSLTFDGMPVKPKLDAWSFPEPAEMKMGLGEIHIEYSAEFPDESADRRVVLANHHMALGSVYLVNVVVPSDRTLRVVSQNRNQSQSVYELEYQRVDAENAAGRRPWAGIVVRLSGLQFSSMFHLGMRHIAEGTDHLLFLLVLLLPAPLVALGPRWSTPASVRQSLVRILSIVTAFTIGHSVTLSLAAMGFVRVPAKPVEILIAFSIFVSAVHAVRPVFPGREAWLAAFFGLIHGLAFAATLDRLGLGRWERLAGILAFNLGIETMQMMVVVLILPSLMLMSRAPAYKAFRVSGAVFAGAASIAWMIERIGDVKTPVDAMVNAIASHALWLAAGLFLLSLGCRYVPAWRFRRGLSEPVRVRMSELGG